jgi:hypothetical protein
MATTFDGAPRPKIVVVSGTVTDNFSVTAARTLVHVVWGYQRVPVSGDVSDDLNGSWGAPVFSDSRVSDVIAAFVKSNSAGGSMTLTLSTGGGAQYYVGTTYIIDTVTSPTVQVSATGATGTSTAATSNSVTPASASGIAIGFITHNLGNPSFTAESGWTKGPEQVDYNGAYQPGVSQYRTLPSAAALTSTITLSASVAWLAGLLVISDAGGGGSTANPWYAYAQQRQRTDLWWTRRNWIWVPAMEGA